MKTNPVIRIIIWSLVLVLLVGILVAGLLYRSFRVHGEATAATEAPIAVTEPLIIYTEDFPITCDTEATVTADGLNVRRAPSSLSEAIDMVEKGTVVSINRAVELDGQRWLGIYAPVSGWINAAYVDSIQEVVFYSSDAIRAESGTGSSYGSTASVTEEVNIRSTPSEDSKALGMLQKGDTVTISRQETVDGETWAYLTSPEGGWVMAKYLEVQKAPAAAESTTNDISLDAKQIREIKIEWAAGDITIEPADVDTIQISESEPAKPEYTMVWKQSGEKLVIRFSENQRVDFDFGVSINDVISKDLTILVPMGWECDSLEVAAASATLTVSDMVIREMDFDGASGVCKFENCTIVELDVDTASGDVYYTGSLDVLDCDAASASVIAVFDNAPSRIDMDSMSGDLDITLHEGVGFTVDLDGLSTEFHSEFGYSQNKNGSYIRGDGKCRITMDAMSGDIYIRKYTTADAVPESTVAGESPSASGNFSSHHHTESCTTDPDSCPDNSPHHTEPHHN